MPSVKDFPFVLSLSKDERKIGKVFPPNRQEIKIKIKCLSITMSRMQSEADGARPVGANSFAALVARR